MGNNENHITSSEETLYHEVCGIIDGTKKHIAVYLNSEICMTNWHIGKRIREDVLNNRRAEYGKQTIVNLSARLTAKYGKGWSVKTLRHCLRCAETFSENEIVSAVQRQFTWTHLKSLMYISDPLARSFYMHMCQIEHWDTRTLDKKIDAQLYERTAISRRPEEVIKQELALAQETHQLIPDMVFRSSYFLDMLDEDSPIRVAQYYTVLPDKKLLAKKLQRAIAIAREHYAEKHSIR